MELRASRKPTITVIEDDPGLRGSLSFAFEVEGFAVQSFADGESWIVSEQLPDCLVIDQNLPGLTGIDMAEALRRRQLRLPIILITTDPPLALKRRAAAADAAIVEKPLLGNALIERIRAVLAG